MRSAYALKSRSSCRMQWSYSAQKQAVSLALPDTASVVDMQMSLKETCCSAVRPNEILNFLTEVNYCQNPQVHDADASSQGSGKAKWRLPIILGGLKWQFKGACVSSPSGNSDSIYARWLAVSLLRYPLHLAKRFDRRLHGRIYLNLAFS